MRKNIFRVFFLLTALLAVFSVNTAQAFVLREANGKTVTSLQLEGKWIVFSYWATWCPVCAREVPVMNRFYQDYKGQVLVYGVNADNLQGAKLNRAIKQFNIQYPVLATDPKRAFRLPEVLALPAAFLISPDGKKTYLVGSQTADSLLAALKQNGW